MRFTLLFCLTLTAIPHVPVFAQGRANIGGTVTDVAKPSAGKVLKEVFVKTKKPLIEQKIDRTVVNVDAMMTAAGSNALEVLAKSPGVIVNSNDDISLNGKNNVLVLIDDKATYMSAQSLAAYLRSLPAGMLDKLELISNPPAKYEANGNAIINIVLKKKLAAGFNGAISLGYSQGVYARSNNAMNINYRVVRFNVFGNAGYSLDHNFSDQSFRRDFFKNDGSPDKQILQNSFSRYRVNGWNGRAGLDYFASARTTMGIILMASIRPRTDLLSYTTNQYRYNSVMHPDSAGRGFTSGTYGAQNYGVNLNLQHKFDSSGKVLTANIDILAYLNTGTQPSAADVFLPNGILTTHEQRMFTLPSDVHIYAGKLDYTLPLPGMTQFDAGIKSSYAITENQSNWFNLRGDTLLPDYSKSNHFRYAENINAAYVSVRREWKRWTMQAGLRLENTVAEGRQFSNPATPDSAFSRHYTSLFPSLFLLFKLDSIGKNTVTLSYSRRIRRPSYQQLNPFLFFQDPYTYNSGNPGLVPSYAQFAELRYSYKGYFGITLSYGGGNRGINPVTQANGDVFVTRPLNYIDARLMGVIPYCAFRPVKWWTLNLSAVLLWQHIKGSAGDVSIDQRISTHEIETSNQLQLSKAWSAELNGFFPGRQAYGQTSNSAIYSISAGLQKKILHEAGMIRFNVNNIFNSMELRSQTLGIGRVNAFNTRVADDRRIGISFIYTFGKAANARRRNDAGSAEEEKARTN